MKPLLAIDIGNTNITMGLFKGDMLVKRLKTPTNSCYLYAKSIKSLRRVMPASGEIDEIDAVISSVAPLALSRLIVELNRLSGYRIRILGRDIKAPIVNRYTNKSEVGQDRLVNAYAAKTLYGSPCVIVDFGTAITFDAISARGEYLGGLILPGIEMSLASLHQKTALLPKVELKPAESLIGLDTVSSIRGGILFGLGSMCDALAVKFRKILGKKALIIATGGNASLIKRYADSIQIVDEDLTLKGLHLVSRR